MKETFTVVFASITGITITFLGGYDSMLKALIIFIILDFITGIISAIINKNISSTISYTGVVKKVALFIMVGFASTIDTLVLLNGESYFRMITISLILSAEGISIIENLGKSGVPIPQKLVSFFETLKDKGDGKNEN